MQTRAVAQKFGSRYLTRFSAAAAWDLPRPDPTDTLGAGLMAIPKHSRLYRSLRWSYQPLRQLREELQTAPFKLRRSKVIRDYLASGSFHGLHIGCGSFALDGWINTDVEALPAVDFLLSIDEPLPFPDQSLDAIYGEEVIEHVPLEQGRLFFREAKRVLKPGGVLRITTPHLKRLCTIFLRQYEVKPEFFEESWLEGEFSPEIWINTMFRAWGHQFLYSADCLERELKAAGFDKLEECPPHKTCSELPQLSGLEQRYGADADPRLFADTLIAEATA